MADPPLTFSRQALREIDRRCAEQFHIPVLVLMENAGRAVADAALRRRARIAGTGGMVGGNGRTLILAGPGNNGGDGLVAARHLHNAGVDVAILLLAQREGYKSPSADQLAIVDAMHLLVRELSPDLTELRDWLCWAHPNDLMIDAIFGTGISRPVTGLALELIRAVNASGHEILTVDIPSGMDCDGGETGINSGGGAESDAPAIIRASETVSFCGWKKGFATGREFTGVITVADIGAPRELLMELADAK